MIGSNPRFGIFVNFELLPHKKNQSKNTKLNLDSVVKRPPYYEKWNIEERGNIEREKTYFLSISRFNGRSVVVTIAGKPDVWELRKTITFLKIRLGTSFTMSIHAVPTVRGIPNKIRICTFGFDKSCGYNRRSSRSLRDTLDIPIFKKIIE
uniref:Uncharacterized protein n=1 Tax=Romanomermis culicivorax TaxID=13658 RepID=A0A915HVE9_ROMCU